MFEDSLVRAKQTHDAMKAFDPVSGRYAVVDDGISHTPRVTGYRVVSGRDVIDRGYAAVEAMWKKQHEKRSGTSQGNVVRGTVAHPPMKLALLGRWGVDIGTQCRIEYIKSDCLLKLPSIEPLQVSADAAYLPVKIPDALRFAQHSEAEWAEWVREQQRVAAAAVVKR